MAKENTTKVANDETSCTDDDDDVKLIDFTTASLGAILVVLIGVFVSQAGELYNAYLQVVDSRLHGRGVARIKLDNGLESNVRAFVERNEPFVCRKCLADTTFWDKDSNILQAVGADTTIPVRVASRTTNNKTRTQFSREAAPGTRGKQTSAYREQNMTMADFVNTYNKHESKEHLYAAQVNIMADLPGLLPHVQETAPPSILLEAVGKTPPRSQRPLSLYLGTGPLTTQTHYDSLENIVCVVTGGQKLFRLFDPPTAAMLLYADRTKYGNGSPVPPDEPSYKEFPMSKYALPSVVELEQGDCLYLPVYWYHSVSTLSPDRTISINWWRKPERNKMVVLEAFFCGNNNFGASAKCH